MTHQHLNTFKENNSNIDVHLLETSQDRIDMGTNTFKNAQGTNITSVTSIYTAPSLKTSILLELDIANTTTAVVETSVQVTDTSASSTSYLVKNAPIPSGSALQVISGQKVISGDSGGITLVGTIGSILGSSLIGLLGYSHGLEIKTIIIVIISGFLSSIVDSILGSTVQARHISKDGMIITEKYKKSFYLYTGSKNINNDIVNLYCTLAGPLVFLLYSIR